MSMWEPFTEDARDGMMLAQETARGLGNRYVGTEHILIGILSARQSEAMKILAGSGITSETVSQAVVERSGRGSEITQAEMTFTTNAIRALECAFAEARDMHKDYVGTEHVLLGILKANGMGNVILRNLGVAPSLVREKAAKIVGRRANWFSYDHVQLAMPAGKEDEARAFYGGVLGMHEAAKPEHLRTRGGVWFASGQTKLHLGVDPDFRPSKKAHPALRCTNYAAVLKQLRGAGITVQTESYEGGEHAYVSDPFGNRIELIG